MTTAVLVLTTWPAAQDAATLARTLVEERLAACVTVLGEMQSTYRWKDAVQTEPERQLIIKTVQNRVDALRRRVQQLHPYDVPEFLVLTAAGGSEAYLGWLAESTAS